MTETRDQLADLKIVARAADAKDGFAPVALNVSEFFGLADMFFIVSGSVERNVQAISDEIENEMLTAGVRAIRREGREGGRWVLLDFGDIIVHVFHQAEREFYQLEKLWRDCPEIEVAALLENAA